MRNIHLKNWEIDEIDRAIAEVGNCGDTSKVTRYKQAMALYNYFNSVCNSDDCNAVRVYFDRLLDKYPITAITNDDISENMWTDFPYCSFYGIYGLNVSIYSNTRYPSLKKIVDNATNEFIMDDYRRISYAYQPHDKTKNIRCDVNCNRLNLIIDRLFPIQFPYYPSRHDRIYVIWEGFTTENDTSYIYIDTAISLLTNDAVKINKYYCIFSEGMMSETKRGVYVDKFIDVYHETKQRDQ